MIALDHALHEVLVDGFSVPLPGLAVMGNQHMVAARDQVVRHVAVRAVRVDAGLLVDQLFDQPSVRQHDGRAGADLQRKDAAVCLSLLVRREEVVEDIETTFAHSVNL